MKPQSYELEVEWTKKLKIPELSCPEVLALSTTRLDPNFPAMGSTRPDLTRISKIWAQPDPKKPKIQVKMAGLTRFSGRKCPQLWNFKYNI